MLRVQNTFNLLPNISFGLKIYIFGVKKGCFKSLLSNLVLNSIKFETDGQNKDFEYEFENRIRI
jgi:hypothetical protein